MKNTSVKRKDEKRLKRSSRTEKREKFATSLFALPSVLGMLVFFVLPFIVIIWHSLINNPVRQDFVGFENYIRLFKNTAFLNALKNTGTFSLMAVPLAIIIPLALALLLNSNLPLKSPLRTVFISPYMVPVASIVLIWQVLFHHNGIINEFTALFGWDPIDWLKSDYSQIVIVALFLWKNIGYNMILFMAALSNVPKDIVEVAMLEGLNSWQRFIHIKLRYLSSSIFFVGMLSLINSFKIFREVYLLTGQYPYDKLYMLQHFMNNTFKSLDYQKLSAAAMIMCAVMVVIIGIMFIVDNKLGGDIEE